MYEGWHISLTEHAKQRMLERNVDFDEVLAVVSHPETIQLDAAHGGKLLSRYLPQWDKIMTVSIRELPKEAVVLVKTVLW